MASNEEEVESATQVLFKFFEETSISGLSYIPRTKSQIQRALWTAVVTSFCALLAIEVHPLLIRYMYYKPTSTSYSLTQESQTFPDVTVCNSRHLEPSLVYSIMEKLEESPVPNYHVDRMSVASNAYPPFVKKYFLAQAPFTTIYTAYLRNRTLGEAFNSVKSKSVFFPLMNLSQEEMNEITIPQWETLMACTFRRENCSAFDILPISDWFYLKCFTLTAVRDTISESGIENGLSFVSIIGSSMYIDNDKVNRGVSLVKFMPGFHESKSSLSGTDELKLVIHPSGSKPLPTMEGFSIPPGFLGYIGFKVRKSKRLTSECISKDPFLSPDDNETYRSKVCLQRCTQKYVIQHCGCKSLVLPDYQNMNHNVTGCGLIWNFPQSICGSLPVPEVCANIMLEALDERKCAEKMTHKLRLDQTVIEKCGCYPECESIGYDIDYSLARWPGELYVDPVWDYDLFEIIDSKREYIKASKRESYFHDHNRYEAIKDFAKVSVYLSDPNTVTTVESLSYTREDLLADLGGLAGLWLGMSIISVVEIFQFLAGLCWCYYKRLATRPEIGKTFVTPIGKEGSLR